MSNQSSSPFPPNAGGDYRMPPGGPGPFTGGPIPQSRGKRGRGPKAPKAPKDIVATKRIMNTQRSLALLFALIMLLAAVVLVTKKTTDTYVAETSHAVTSLSPIGKADIVGVKVPATTTLATGAFTGKSAEAAVKAAVKGIGGLDPIISLPANTVLSDAFFSKLPQIASQLGLPSSNYLVSVNANVAGAVGGVLTTGSKVEVLWEPQAGKPVVLAKVATVVAVRAGLSAYESAASSSSTGSPGTSGTTGASGQSGAGVVNNPIPGIYILSADPTSAEAIGGAEANSSDSNGALTLLYLPPGSTLPGNATVSGPRG